MKKIFIDAGTTHTKILKIEDNIKKYYNIRSADLKNTDEIKNYNSEICEIYLTGHTKIYNEKENTDFKKIKYENEIIALSLGAKQYLLDGWTVLDLGSRDIKYIKYKNQKFSDMDWNTTCASATGATVEMLLKFYDVKNEDLKFNPEKYAVTCGIFGLEKIMDEVSRGKEASIAISKFIHGIAYRAYLFTKKPEKICLSGGFCQNPCFIESLEQYCKVLPLGRFALCDGLYAISCGQSSS